MLNNYQNFSLLLNMNKKIIIGLIFILVFTKASYCQLWYITRGLDTDEVAWALDTDEQGNIYWAIEQKDQWPHWYYNIVLYKISLEGQEIWQSESWDNGTGFNDIAFVATVSGDHIYLAGRTDSTGLNTSGDALLMKYKIDNGELEWAMNITSESDFGYQEIDGISIQPDGIFLTGWTQGEDTDMDILIQKCDLSGNTLWEKSWDFESLHRFDGANGHLVIDNDFIYVAASVNRTNIGSLDGDGALVCFNRADGSYEWNESWAGTLYQDALGLTMSADSMLYTVGYSGTFDFGSQILLNKFSRNGDLIWSKTWGGTGTEDSRTVVADGDSIVYVVGTTSSYGNSDKDIFVLKYDSFGTLIDSIIWGGPYQESAQDAVLWDSYLFITGETQSFGNGHINQDHKTDGLLLKIDVRTMTAPESEFSKNFLSTSNKEFNIYPNPICDNFVINCRNINDLYDIEIFDISGKSVTKAFNVVSGDIFDFSCYDTGLYIIRIKENNKVAASFKIIKN
jgi:hypothetical protein